jgi:hypothetical protein
MSDFSEEEIRLMRIKFLSEYANWFNGAGSNLPQRGYLCGF